MTFDSQGYRRFTRPLVVAEILLAGLLAAALSQGWRWTAGLSVLGMGLGLLAIALALAAAGVLERTLLKLLRQNGGCLEAKAVHRLLVSRDKGGHVPVDSDEALALLSTVVTRLEKKKLIKADGRYIHLLYRRGPDPEGKDRPRALRHA